jgi:hypothetical protein
MKYNLRICKQRIAPQKNDTVLRYFPKICDTHKKPIIWYLKTHFIHQWGHFEKEHMIIMIMTEKFLQLIVIHVVYKIDDSF